MARRIALVRAELVEVVVAGGRLVIGDLLVRAERPLADPLQLAAGAGPGRTLAGQWQQHCPCGEGACGAAQAAPFLVDCAVRDFRGSVVRWTSTERHRPSPSCFRALDTTSGQRVSSRIASTAR